MNLLENIRLALAGLKSSKMRSFLTMLGIIIGIGSVIAIVTLGNSMTGSITDSLASMGISNITVNLRMRESSQQRGFGQADIDEADRITDEMIETLLTAYPDEFKAVSITQGAGSGKVQDGRLYANISVTGINTGYRDGTKVDMVDGRFIIDRDIEGSKQVAVVSDKLAESIFGSTDPLEKEIKVYLGDQILTYVIVGVYKYEAGAMMMNVSEQDITTTMYIPITTAQRLASAGSGYRSFTLVTTGDVPSAESIGIVESFFARYYGENSKYRVSASTMESMVEQVTTMLATVQLAIAAIAAISLLVGGIGVMNIMLVSVTERTREIGTRKALGARNSAIRIQFVVEAMIICLIGGIIGIGLGIGLGSFGSNLLGTPAKASLDVIVIAVAFSMAIGIFFGYYPANKAAKLDPIEALRYE